MNKGFVSLGAAAVFSVAATKAAVIELVSQSSETATVSANGSSLAGTFSPDGKFIVFTSTAGDLANLPENGRYQLFLLNTTNNAIQLVTVAQNGGFAHGNSVYGSVSADNRFIAFQSSANDFTTGDTNQTSDVYVRDLTTSVTTLVSHDPAGLAGNDHSEYPQISANGEVVVFQSNARGLTANDTNALADVFAWKRADNSLQLVSVSANEFSGNADASDFSMTPDGRYVLFVASGANLVVSGKTSGNEVYLRDLQSGTTRWVSSVVTNLAGLTTATSANAAMSVDGRFVFFVATPTNITATSTMVRVDLNDDSTVIVATNIPPPAAYSESFGPSVSDDGQFAAFTYRTNVVCWSAATGEFERVDVNTTGAAGVVSDTPIISHDGLKVAFMSASSNLVADVGNGETQIYVRDIAGGETRLISKSLSGTPTSGNEFAVYQFSPDGSTLLFDSGSAELVSGDNNDESDVFSWNAANGAVSLLSASRASTPSLTAFGPSVAGRDSVSADGRFIGFRSLAKLHPNDTNDTYDVYVFDRVAKTNVVASAGPDGFSVGGGAAGLPMISADGTKVAFESSTKGLAGPNDNRAGTSVYVRDLQTGTLVNISGANTGSLTLRLLSANGRYVYFTSAATATSAQLHRYDLVDNVDVLEATATSFGDMSTSADGSRIAYVAGTSPLYLHNYSTGDPREAVAAGSTDALSRVMLSADGSILVYYQSGVFRQTNVITGATSQSGPVRPTRATMSADARIVAFESRPATGTWEIRVLDWATGETNLISRAAGLATNGNGNSEAPTVSADGRFIAFESWATDLVANDNNNIKDVFLYDRLADQLTLVSHLNGTTSPGNSASLNPFFGKGEPFLVFSSGAADLVAGDLNDSIDVFVTRMEEPSIFAIQSVLLAGDGSASLKWKAESGQRYQVEFTSTLNAPTTWAAVGSEITGTGSDVTAPMAGPGFYRLRLVE
jgi:Tol biopolymer transport system component